MVDNFSKARKPPDRLRISLGDFGIKPSGARIQDPYRKDCLPGKPIPGVVNFPPKPVANFFSEALTTGFYLPPGEVVIVHPERKVPNEAKFG